MWKVNVVETFECVARGEAIEAAVLAQPNYAPEADGAPFEKVLPWAEAKECWKSWRASISLSSCCARLGQQPGSSCRSSTRWGPGAASGVWQCHARRRRGWSWSSTTTEIRPTANLGFTRLFYDRQEQRAPMAFIQVVNLRLDDGSVVEAFVSSDGIARLQAGRIEAVETLPAPEPIEQPPQALSEEEQREWWGDHMRRQTDLFRRQGLIR